MFNDMLSREDCEHLISDLAKCAFPFQCAHGRPSMIPVLDVGSGPRIGGWRENHHGNKARGGKASFQEVEKWNKWLTA